MKKFQIVLEVDLPDYHDAEQIKQVFSEHGPVELYGQRIRCVSVKEDPLPFTYRRGQVW